MVNLYKCVSCFAAIFFSLISYSSQAQSVLDPNDPVITYDSVNPPAQPPYGQIGKWVRTMRMSWNTTMYKAYIYKGLAFRLHFPKSYKPGVNDGKKYPLLLFFHGHGEFGPIYDNEFHLLLGHQGFDDAIKNGTFDGYVLSPQTTFFFGPWDYDKIIEIVQYMIENNKVDPFDIVANGLSQGGEASWKMLERYPTYIAAAAPMSWSHTDFTNPAFVNTVKYTPVWVSQGGKDQNPTPSTAFSVRDAMVAAGANYKLSYYPDVAHDTWYNVWSDPNFWPFVNSAYSSNPWMLGGVKAYWPGQPIDGTIGIAAGFSGYQWRKNGVEITGATGNTIHVSEAGVYDARVLRDGVWSSWSHVPVTINPGHVEAEDYVATKGTGVERTQDEGGGLNVGWIGLGSWLDYSINPYLSGNYTLRLRVAAPSNGAKILVKNAQGNVLATVSLPETGGWQSWQTVSVPIPLQAGEQLLRLESAANTGWNINWLEIKLSGSNENLPPTANAGADQTITLPANTVTLNGSGKDADGNITSYKWEKVAGGNVTFSSADVASVQLSNLTEGIYTFRLTVTDNQGATGFDEVTITVKKAEATAPTTRIEAENWIAMNGVLTENTADVGGGKNVGWIDNGDWMDYSITTTSAGTYKINLRLATPYSGAQLQVLSNTGIVLATVNVPTTGGWQNWQTVSASIALSAGSQTIRIKCTTNAGWNINWLEIAGAGSVTNTPPVAHAGADKNITLPTSSVMLNGSGTDADGTIVSYRWSKKSGGQAVIAKPNEASTQISGLAEGSYTFTLTVTDNNGATATDDVAIIVAKTPVSGPSTRIEAENWMAMHGVLTEKTKDIDGNLNVGWIESGDWMDYNITTTTAGIYQLNFRIATPYYDAKLLVKDANGTLLASVALPRTGTWQTWQTISTTASLKAGTQPIRIECSGAGWNINWLEIKSVSSGALNSRTAENLLQVAPVNTGQSLSVYPNPAHDRFTLTMEGMEAGRVYVKVFTTTGVLKKVIVLNKTAGTIHSGINIAELPTGHYVLSVEMNGKVETKRLLKQ